MGPRLTIACVYRPGGGFTEEYPVRLRDAFAQHCKAEHDFVCITNNKIPGVTTDRLVNMWPGYWCKLDLFLPGRFQGPVVYCDLDTLIFNDITDICTYPHGFTCGTNWKQQNGDGKVINSAFMAWDGREDLRHLYYDFRREYMVKYMTSWERWGDQGWIQDKLGRPFESFQKLFPGRFVHYKTHVRGPTKEFPGKVPNGASIVAFSGRPRPHEVQWSLPLAD